jgi:hypothetical protein
LHLACIPDHARGHAFLCRTRESTELALTN